MNQGNMNLIRRERDTEREEGEKLDDATENIDFYVNIFMFFYE